MEARVDVESGGGSGSGRRTDRIEGGETVTLTQPPQHREQQVSGAMSTLLLAYQSLGVVYGDLGTSPVNVFSAATRLTHLSEEDLLGTLSLIIWTLTFLVLIKYAFVVLHANDDGEGGTFALYSLLCRHINFKSSFSMVRNAGLVEGGGGGRGLRRRTKEFLERSSCAHTFLTVIVLLGTCMVIGDGALTPATCVVSALQGIQSRSSKITQEHVVWMSAVVLITLFGFQRCGTSKVSFLFSPVMLVWFGTNVTVGVYNIIKYYPSILKAVSPYCFLKFFLRNHNTAFRLLGAVFLSITGAEAMFADLGHFNKRAIQLGFCFVVYPSLVLSYAGETAYLVKNPEKIGDAYYSSIPESVYWPMFVVSTMASVVASQSMISATFSIVKQSLALGCFPRVTIVHTSSDHRGQVYCPEINYILMILTVALVVGFGGGVELANAYGVVVIWVMIITTMLTSLVMLLIWKTNILLVLLGFFLPYIFVESIFMASLMNKIPQGGWVPFAISSLFLTVMLSWTYGRSRKSRYEADRKLSIRELDDMLSSSTVHRASGICFFFADVECGVVPPIVRRYIQHTKSVREIMVVVSVRTLPVRSVAPGERWKVERLGEGGVYGCLVQFGYKECSEIDGGDGGGGGGTFVASIIERLREMSGGVAEEQEIKRATEEGVVFVVGRTVMRASKEDGMIARFTIDCLYRFLQKNSRPSISLPQIPSLTTLQIGMVYEL